MYNVLVCMPYSKAWSDHVWQALSRIIQKDTTKSLNVYRVDTAQFQKDMIAELIESELMRAHVVIFDLTEVNPNVHIEVGFALALKTPTFFITQDRKWVTTHLQGRIVEEYDAKSDDSLDRLSAMLLLRIKDKIKAIKEEEDVASRVIRLEEHYQVECYSNREVAGLENYFRNATRRIDILTTNLSFLFEKYDQASDRTYFDEITTALSKPGSMLKVQILTLDPESDFAAKRGKQLGYSPAVFRDALRKARADTLDVAKNYPLERFEVRAYGDFPNQITFRIDNFVFHCVVAQPTQSRNHLTFKLDKRQLGVENSFINHFRNVWGDASAM